MSQLMKLYRGDSASAQGREMVTDDVLDRTGLEGRVSRPITSYHPQPHRSRTEVQGP